MYLVADCFDADVAVRLLGVGARPPPHGARRANADVTVPRCGLSFFSAAAAAPTDRHTCKACAFRSATATRRGMALGSTPRFDRLLRIVWLMCRFNPPTDSNSDAGSRDHGLRSHRSSTARAHARPTSSKIASVYGGGADRCCTFSARPSSPLAAGRRFTCKTSASSGVAIRSLGVQTRCLCGYVYDADHTRR